MARLRVKLEVRNKFERKNGTLKSDTWNLPVLPVCGHFGCDLSKLAECFI